MNAPPAVLRSGPLLGVAVLLAFHLAAAPAQAQLALKPTAHEALELTGLEALELTAQEALADTTVITVRTFDVNLDFEPSSISARQGQVVRIVYVNEGLFPHNLVVVRDADDIPVLGQAAYDAEETGFVPLEHKEKLIAYTGLASPGEKVEVVFTMPAAGVYTFVCLVAGHYNMMLGTLRSIG